MIPIVSAHSYSPSNRLPAGLSGVASAKPEASAKAGPRPLAVAGARDQGLPGRSPQGEDWTGHLPFTHYPRVTGTIRTTPETAEEADRAKKALARLTIGTVIFVWLHICPSPRCKLY